LFRETAGSIILSPSVAAGLEWRALKRREQDYMPYNRGSIVQFKFILLGAASPWF
jgi:hypothetical protein